MAFDDTIDNSTRPPSDWSSADLATAGAKGALGAIPIVGAKPTADRRPPITGAGHRRRLRSEAGLTAKEAGRTLRRSRQSVHNLIAKAAPDSDPVAAELVIQVREALYHAIQSLPQSSLDGPGEDLRCG